MKEIAIKITDRCDKFCEFCCEDSLPNGRPLKFSIIKNILREMRGKYSVVGLTGGEPVLYKSGKKTIVDVVKECKKNKITPTLMCGGVFDTAEYRKIFKNKIMRTGANYVLSFSILRPRWKEVFITALKKIPSASRINCIHQFFNNQDAVEKTCRELMLKYSKERPFHIYNLAAVPVGQGKNMGVVEEVDYDCELVKRGQDYLSINEFGEILPCCAINFKGEDFYEQGWKKTFYSKGDLARTLNRAKKFCSQKCKFNYSK